MVVELKSPKCSISKKELNQIDDYAFTIEQHSGLPNEKVKYKLLLISSKLTKYAKSKVSSARKKYPETPFLYDKKTEKNIEILGINAKHKLGRNSNYLYKVGTWAFYSKDGELEKYIEYDVNGKEVKK